MEFKVPKQGTDTLGKGRGLDIWYKTQIHNIILIKDH